jgi:hypothetical protein
VGDQHERGAQLAVQVEHQLHDLLAGGEVEAAGGLVGQQQAGCTTKARASATRCCSPPDSTFG